MDDFESESLKNDNEMFSVHVEQNFAVHNRDSTQHEEEMLSVQEGESISVNAPALLQSDNEIV